LGTHEPDRINQDLDEIIIDRKTMSFHYL